MATYRVKDLLDRLYEISQQGCEYVEIVELDADEDEDIPASLSFSGIVDEYEEIDFDDVDSCEYGDEPDDNESDDENCYQVQFTYDEIATIASALANVNSIYKNVVNDKQYDQKERDAFRTMSTKTLNLQAKIDQAFKKRK